MPETPEPIAPALPVARGRGRPRKVDDATRSRICAMVSIGCNLPQAARHAGCSYPTIRRETLRNAEFREKLRRAVRKKLEINSLRRGDSELDRSLSELHKKLAIGLAKTSNDL